MEWIRGITLNIKKGTNEDPNRQEVQEIFVAKLPEIRNADLELGALLAGKWNPRRVVITKDIIAFAHAGDDFMIDHIPMAEIEIARAMDTIEDQDVDKSKFQNAVMITTIPDGHNSGRTYHLQCNSRDLCDQFVQQVCSTSKLAKRRVEASTAFAKSQLSVRRIFDSVPFQTLSASLILLNFLVCVIDAQFGRKLNSQHGSETPLGKVDDKLNNFFTAIFALELFVNAYANWLKRFIMNGWNVLDLFVVTMSLVDQMVDNIPSWLVRLMRAFRVIRLFGRVKALKKMIAAVSASIFGMTNAFFILVVVLSIFSILGVSLFGDIADQEFGRFNRAFITMFRVACGDPWPPSLPVLDEDGSIDWRTSLYMCSFTIVAIWVLLEVSVAVLLDNFVAATARMENGEQLKKVKERKQMDMYKSPLEPLVARLAYVYVDDADLTSQLQTLFEVLDSNCTGTLSTVEFCVAMKKLEFKPRIYVTESDFVSLTHNGDWCDAKGNLTVEGFDRMMRDQIRIYALSLLATSPMLMNQQEESFTQQGPIKMILNEQLRHREMLDRILTVVSPKVGMQAGSLKRRNTTMSGGVSPDLIAKMRRHSTSALDEVVADVSVPRLFSMSKPVESLHVESGKTKALWDKDSGMLRGNNQFMVKGNVGDGLGEGEHEDVSFENPPISGNCKSGSIGGKNISRHNRSSASAETKAELEMESLRKELRHAQEGITGLRDELVQVLATAQTLPSRSAASLESASVREMVREELRAIARRSPSRARTAEFSGTQAPAPRETSRRERSKPAPLPPSPTRGTRGLPRLRTDEHAAVAVAADRSGIKKQLQRSQLNMTDGPGEVLRRRGGAASATAPGNSSVPASMAGPALRERVRSEIRRRVATYSNVSPARWAGDTVVASHAPSVDTARPPPHWPFDSPARTMVVPIVGGGGGVDMSRWLMGGRDGRPESPSRSTVLPSNASWMGPRGASGDHLASGGHHYLAQGGPNGLPGRYPAHGMDGNMPPVAQLRGDMRHLVEESDGWPCSNPTPSSGSPRLPHSAGSGDMTAYPGAGVEWRTASIAPASANTAQANGGWLALSSTATAPGPRPSLRGARPLHWDLDQPLSTPRDRVTVVGPGEGPGDVRKDVWTTVSAATAAAVAAGGWQRPSGWGEGQMAWSATQSDLVRVARSAAS